MYQKKKANWQKQAKGKRFCPRKKKIPTTRVDQRAGQKSAMVDESQKGLCGNGTARQQGEHNRRPMKEEE